MATVGRRFYSIEDIVAMGYGSRTTVWRRIKQGNIKAIRHGSCVLTPCDEFETYLEKLAAQGGGMK